MQVTISGEDVATSSSPAKSDASPLGLFPLLALTSALGVLLVSISYDLSRYGNLALESLFLPGLLVIYVPPLVRLLSAVPGRIERLCLLCLVGMCFFHVQLMVSPLYISSYDALLHWITADTIQSTQHLYGANSLLAVSPYYPGLEIVTNALSSISGFSTFTAGVAVIAASRLLMVLVLFLFYEQVTISSRVAGIATMIYMTNPHFLFFDAIFSYETLALPLATFMLYMLARYSTLSERRGYRWMLAFAWLALAALTVTHHMTDYVFVGLLVFWTIVSSFQASGRHMRGVLAVFALSGLALALAYAFLLPGNPVWEYLSSYFATAFSELEHILAGTDTARQLFASPGAQASPIWDRLLMLGSVALATLGLPFGLLGLWKYHRRNVLAVTLGIVSLAYPVTQVFRFSSYGAEITDRSAAFLFIAIAYVLAVFVTQKRHNRRTTALVACALPVMLLGGVLLEIGPAYSGLPGPYMVIADGRSIEPTSIEAARWSLSHLGTGNRIATDRINQTLFGTFGQQYIVTQPEDGVNISLIFDAPSLDQQTIVLLQKANIRYLVVDLRLSTSLPLLGYYYESDEPGAFHLTSPISREALTKFSNVPQIDQIFDDGSIIIYDVSALTGQGSRGYALVLPSSEAASLCC
jgi:hypothetical protein